MDSHEGEAMKRAGCFGRMVRAILWSVVAVWGIWACGALWFDFPFADWRPVVAAGFLVVALFLVIWWRGGFRAMAACGLLAGSVTAAWLGLQPRAYRDWKPEVALVPVATADGGVVTIRNVRNFTYRTTDDFDAIWETRSYDLSNLKGVDLFLNYWGSENMAHPIVSFDFGANGRICFSLETRPEKGEAYSALRGIYRGFELVCVAADERDVIGVRTNHRKGEDSFLYRLKAPRAREMFLEYVSLINQLAAKPEWYNAITNNCTTTLRYHRSVSKRADWDWRMLLNGRIDRMLHEHGYFKADVPFEELRDAGHINARARDADKDPEFSKLIRLGVPGCS